MRTCRRTSDWQAVNRVSGIERNDSPSSTPHLLAFSGNRIKPAQSLKSCEIAVCGTERQTVLYCQRGKVGVRHEIAVDARQREKFAQ